jgi:hypothetical protein
MIGSRLQQYDNKEDQFIKWIESNEEGENTMEALNFMFRKMR